MEFIHGITLVHLKMRCWSGEKKASRDRDIDLGVGGHLPPEKLLDLGRKKIFPPKSLVPLASKRKAAERVCLEVGTRFMNGYAVPDDAIPELINKLEAIQKAFDDELAVFMADFEINKSNWLADNSEFEHLIRDQVPDKVDVERSFEFKFNLFKVNAVEGYEPETAEIANQVLHEVGVTCKQLSDRLLERKRSISGELLIDMLCPLIDKLEALSFGNGRIIKVLDEFLVLQQSIPFDEEIDNTHYSMGHVMTFLSMCSDSYKLEHILDGSFSVMQLIEQINQGEELSPISHNTELNTKPARSVGLSAGAYF